MKNKTTRLTRRSLLKFAGLGTTITLIYSYIRGIRFPVLSWESAQLATTSTTDHIDFSFKDMIRVDRQNTSSIFRAYAPEPEIELSFRHESAVTLVINNIAIDTVLEMTRSDLVSVEEEVNGINRKYDFLLTD